MSGIDIKNKVVEVFRASGGQLRMSEAIEHGISRYMLYTLRDTEVIEQVSRGVYRLTELPPMSNPDLVTVGLRFPNAVICLISALAFHNITTQIPRWIYVAVPKNGRPPSLSHPPLSVHKFSKQAFEAGIEEHLIDGVSVKVYSVEKTLADCFKFRNKIGMDVVLEALKMARKQLDLSLLISYAKTCRVEKVMYPYLEAIL